MLPQRRRLVRYGPAKDARGHRADSRPRPRDLLLTTTTKSTPRRQRRSLPRTRHLPSLGERADLHQPHAVLRPGARPGHADGQAVAQRQAGGDAHLQRVRSAAGPDRLDAARARVGGGVAAEEAEARFSHRRVV